MSKITPGVPPFTPEELRVAKLKNETWPTGPVGGGLSPRLADELDYQEALKKKAQDLQPNPVLRPQSATPVIHPQPYQNPKINPVPNLVQYPNQNLIPNRDQNIVPNQIPNVFPNQNPNTFPTNH